MLSVLETAVEAKTEKTDWFFLKMRIFNVSYRTERALSCTVYRSSVKLFANKGKGGAASGSLRKLAIEVSFDHINLDP